MDPSNRPLAEPTRGWAKNKKSSPEEWAAVILEARGKLTPHLKYLSGWQDIQNRANGEPHPTINVMTDPRILVLPEGLTFGSRLIALEEVGNATSPEIIELKTIMMDGKGRLWLWHTKYERSVPGDQKQEIRRALISLFQRFSDEDLLALLKRSPHLGSWIYESFVEVLFKTIKERERRLISMRESFSEMITLD